MTKRRITEPMDVINIRSHGKTYQKWLMALVDGRDFRILFDILHNTEFIWCIMLDENRAEDGINLRYRFQTELGLSYLADSDEHPCSVLEMLIGLSFTIEDSIMYNPVQGDRTSTWFWMMISNLGIYYTDRDFMDANSVGDDLGELVYDKIRYFLDREYGSDGDGGLFPLRHSRFNQTETELWYQANEYACSVLL